MNGQLKKIKEYTGLTAIIAGTTIVSGAIGMERNEQWENIPAYIPIISSTLLTGGAYLCGHSQGISYWRRRVNERYHKGLRYADDQ